LTQCPFFWGAGAAAAEPEPLDAQPPSRPSTSERTDKERIRATFMKRNIVKHTAVGKLAKLGEAWRFRYFVNRINSTKFTGANASPP